MILPNSGSRYGTLMVLKHLCPSLSQLNLAGPSSCGKMSTVQWGQSGTYDASDSSRFLLTAEKRNKVKKNLLPGTLSHQNSLPEVTRTQRRSVAWVIPLYLGQLRTQHLSFGQGLVGARTGLHEEQTLALMHNALLDPEDCSTWS